MFTYHETTTHPEKPKKQQHYPKKSPKTKKQEQTKNKKEPQAQGGPNMKKIPVHAKPHLNIHHILKRDYLKKRQKTNVTPKNNKTSIITKIKRKIPSYTFHNKKAILICRDIERNFGSKLTLLLNRPQIHQVKHNTYFYKNTTQIKIEYEHIFKLFKPYLNLSYIENTNPHLKQFCINNQQCLHSHLFYAILITLAPTPT
jgi:hypothetical protein